MTEREIFVAALQKEDLAGRQAYLDEACAGQPELRRQIEHLLGLYEGAGSFLEKAAAGSAPTGAFADAAEPSAPTEAPGDVIGPYKLVEPIGEGGMGTVWMAQQTEPVKRLVALKLIKAGMDSKQVIARFEAERQALALMDHPNIARVLEGGTTSAGRPYFVMDLVKGVPLTKYCDEHHLTPRQRLELFIPVCQAVQHAHQKGIIHRDLKPSNILVAPYDGKPVVKVIDFGVAKAAGQQLTDRTLVTGFGAVVGTLEYMSPEQAELNNQDIDTRSDIYSLGVLLYELLAGSPPFSRKELEKAGMLEMLRVIREQEPSKPSTKLSTADGLPTLAANRGTEPAKLTALVRGELDWIVMKALEKDRSRRYETANAFAMDVQRYLQDEAVQACPPSVLYRFRKFARRNRVALGVTAGVLMALLLSAVGTGWVLWDKAEQRAARAQQVAEIEKTVREAMGSAEMLGKQAEALPLTTSREAAAAEVVWQRAADILAGAAAALRTGQADAGLRQRVADLGEALQKGRNRAEQRRTLAQRCEQLLRDLDDARMASTTWIDSHFDYAEAVAKYARAFAAYGIEVRSRPVDALARQIAAEEPDVRDALIVALDFWTLCAAKESTARSPVDLRAIARAADQDSWRQEYRQALMNQDGLALMRLSTATRKRSMPPISLDLLSRALRSMGRREEAMDLLRWAHGRHPTDFWISFTLGLMLDKTKPVTLEEAIGCYRVALAIRPNSSAAHTNLGNALLQKKQVDEAIAELRTAIAFEPRNAEAHLSLATALRTRMQPDEAIAEYRKAIALNPKSAGALLHLGITLSSMDRFDESIAAFRDCIKIAPKDASAHFYLGKALSGKGLLDEEIAAYREALACNPQYRIVHYTLAIALRKNGRMEQTIAEAREAVRSEPKNPANHVVLCQAFLASSRFADARKSSKTAVEVMRPNDSWRPFVVGLLERCDRLLLLEPRVNELLAGKIQAADSLTSLDLAELCALRRDYAAAVRFYSAAFNDGKLTANLNSRYNAACCAALAAAGQGNDAGGLDAQERRRLRKQGMAWLRTDLALWTKWLVTASPAELDKKRGSLRTWQRDGELETLRGPEALKKLSAEEKQACQQLWSDVAALVRKAYANK